MASNPASLIPLFGGLFDDSQEQAMNALRQNVADYEQLRTPDVKFENYVPEEYKTSLINEDPILRARQLALLDQMGKAAETGFTDADNAAYQLATNKANQAAKQRSDALLQEAARRGIGGSGVELGLREMAGQEAMNRANEANLQRAADSSRMMAAYQQAYGNQLGDVRGADYKTQAANQQAINRFNELNTGERNRAQIYNQERPQALQQQNFQNQMARLGGLSNARSGLAQGYAAENAANSAERGQLTGLAASAGLGAAGMGPWAASKPTGQDNYFNYMLSRQKEADSRG